MGHEVPIINMFSAACYQFSRSIGKDTLHPVPSVDEGGNVKPFQLVIKSTKRRLIFWEKAHYEVTDFQLTDVMTDTSPLKVQTVRKTLATYNGTTKLSLKGKFGADICKEILDVELEAEDNITLSIQFGKVIKTEVPEPALLDELNQRNINLDHALIKSIREDQSKVLCIITGVDSLDAGGTIHRVKEIDASASLKADLLKKASVSGDAIYDKDRNLGLPPGAPVAYNLHELNVDTKNGAIQLVLTSGSHGGFKCCVGYDEVDATSVGTGGEDAGFSARQKLELDIQRAEEIFRPIFELPDAKYSELMKDLLKLLSVPRDISLLADIVRQEENSGQIVLKVSEIEGKLLVPKAHWMRLLTAVGFTEQGDKLIQPSSSSVMESVGSCLDAATLLEDEMLDFVRSCPLDLAEPLCTVLKEGIRGKAVAEHSVVKPLLGNTDVKKLLLDLEFRLAEQDYEIMAPLELHQSVEGAYWLVFCLWGKGFSKQ